ncbi:Uncharacterised protein [Enterococcus faecalis]|uniref:Lipoprotein n=1 Tax=Enterococcus faecalis TaxID=1351 RepID=A0AAX2KMA3_ENTFL|nr:Uncharacterised protein [Enterococcus faecalis]
MKLFIGKKWLLLTAATLLLSGCASLEQKAQDISNDGTGNLLKLFRTIIVYQLNLSVMLMEIPPC